MQIHRTSPTRDFTIFRNELLRDHSISWCAAGVLMYLVSLPEQARASVRSLAEKRKEGRARIASALCELEKARYLRREVRKDQGSGLLRTVYVVFDHPYEAGDGEPVEAAPANEPESGWNLASGERPAGAAGPKPLVPSTSPKEPPSLTESAEGPDDPAVRTGRAARFLHGLGRTVPALSLGAAEALKLAPLVEVWWERGASDAVLAKALTAGLPATVHSAPKLLADRLRRKCPPVPPAPPEPLLRHACEGCGARLPAAGRCAACVRAVVRESRGSREPVPLAEGVLGFMESAKRGAEAARAAMRGLGGGAVTPPVVAV
ncbi:hypothetical protein GCM10010329_65990 [Streptomyces spiroverticillatus]|uniref:Helix-turn-helix domain-containing protein n=1 Tax=Streptomyces finlayi TaxID=67296 RepID=A0A919CDE7_9ACTN|nr:hypothetical protein [Streptomyces finlayi]GHA33752.1 hypothetical protein GCM10010329_65990 [Streptomyces spiroverticillatus]GHD11456.1 hypothetical protein GCM10010334_67540 [Streptomyces finlayi]